MTLKKSLLVLIFSALLVTFIMMPSLKGVNRAATDDQIAFSPDDSMKDLQVKIGKMREQIRRAGGTYDVGINPAMQYPIEQLCTANPDLAKVTSGVNPELVGQTLIPIDPIIIIPIFPSSYTGLCSFKPVQNISTCTWNFVTCEAAEAAFYKKFGTVYNFSEQYVLDCNCSGYSCTGGGWLSFDTFVSCPTTCGTGVPLESGYYAYNGIKYTCEPCYPPTKYALAGYSQMCTGICSISSIKSAIQTYGMVTCAVTVTSYFQAYTSGCFSYDTTSPVNHPIIICGWNDTTPCATGGWRLKNSWSTAWGDGGYMWIKYGVSQIGTSATYCYR
ncbi:MAG: C1 family peptidase [Candidatus Omnitrophota bacterium]